MTDKMDILSGTRQAEIQEVITCLKNFNPTKVALEVLQEKEAIRIGFPSGNTDRVVIKTEKETYILFTSIGGIKEKILTLMNKSVR